MGDNDANFIHMGGGHDAQPALAFLPFAHNQVTQGIHADFIGVGCHFFFDQVAHGLFVSGRTSGLNQFADQFFHGISLESGNYERSGASMSGVRACKV